MMRESWLPAAPESAHLARAFVRDAAVEYGLGGDGTWDLMLATSEAVSNAVRHGAPCRNDGQGILLRVFPWHDGVCVEVGDCGTFEPRSLAPGQDATHGRGIPMITAVVDYFELLPGGPLTRVRFAKRRALAAA
jgi:anti-sigma regulatory factor (Ser/Thr protein kinase)